MQHMKGELIEHSEDYYNDDDSRTTFAIPPGRGRREQQRGQTREGDASDNDMSINLLQDSDSEHGLNHRNVDSQTKNRFMSPSSKTLARLSQEMHDLQSCPNTLISLLRSSPQTRSKTKNRTNKAESKKVFGCKKKSKDVIVAHDDDENSNNVSMPQSNLPSLKQNKRSKRTNSIGSDGSNVVGQSTRFNNKEMKISDDTKIDWNELKQNGWKFKHFCIQRKKSESYGIEIVRMAFPNKHDDIHCMVRKCHTNSVAYHIGIRQGDWICHPPLQDCNTEVVNNFSYEGNDFVAPTHLASYEIVMKWAKQQQIMLCVLRKDNEKPVQRTSSEMMPAKKTHTVDDYDGNDDIEVFKVDPKKRNRKKRKDKTKDKILARAVNTTTTKRFSKQRPQEQQKHSDNKHDKQATNDLDHPRHTTEKSSECTTKKIDNPSFCMRCNWKGKNNRRRPRKHHAWCHQNECFDNSGAKQILERIHKGIKAGCKICEKELQTGKLLPRQHHLPICRSPISRDSDEDSDEDSNDSENEQSNSQNGKATAHKSKNKPITRKRKRNHDIHPQQPQQIPTPKTRLSSQRGQLQSEKNQRNKKLTAKLQNTTCNNASKKRLRTARGPSPKKEKNSDDDSCVDNKSTDQEDDVSAFVPNSGKRKYYPCSLKAISRNTASSETKNSAKESNHHKFGTEQLPVTLPAHNLATFKTAKNQGDEGCDTKLSGSCGTVQRMQSNWVSYDGNPWGPSGFMDGDVVLFGGSSNTTVNTSAARHHEVTIPSQRFAINPFGSLSSPSGVTKTNATPEDGFTLLVLERDPMGKVPWGFHVRLDDFSNACVVTSVDPFSPAQSAKLIGLEFTGRGTEKLMVNDIIMVVNGKPVGGMTIFALHLELECSGPKLILAVSRYKGTPTNTGRESEATTTMNNFNNETKIDTLDRDGWCEIGNDIALLQESETSGMVNNRLPSEGLNVSQISARGHDERHEKNLVVRKSNGQRRASVKNEDNQSSNNYNNMVGDAAISVCDKGFNDDNMTVSDKNINDDIDDENSNRLEPSASGAFSKTLRSSQKTNSPNLGTMQMTSKNAHDRDNDNDGSDWDQDYNAWLGCVCGRIHRKNKAHMFWIQCENCQSWYDVAKECVGFSESEAVSMGMWTCWACPSSSSDSCSEVIKQESQA